MHVRSCSRSYVGYSECWEIREQELVGRTDELKLSRLDVRGMLKCWLYHEGFFCTKSESSIRLGALAKPYWHRAEWYLDVSEEWWVHCMNISIPCHINTAARENVIIWCCLIRPRLVRGEHGYDRMGCLFLLGSGPERKRIAGGSWRRWSGVVIGSSRRKEGREYRSWWCGPLTWWVINDQACVSWDAEERERTYIHI